MLFPIAYVVLTLGEGDMPYGIFEAMLHSPENGDLQVIGSGSSSLRGCSNDIVAMLGGISIFHLV